MSDDGFQVLAEGGPARLTAGLATRHRLDLAAHRTLHVEPPRFSGEELFALAAGVHLRGRGGAAFPFAYKIEAVLRTAQRRRSARAVVVNASEGEPASSKDRMLTTRVPHLVLDGATLAAHAIGASRIVLGVEDADAVGSLTAALAERPPGVPVRVYRVPRHFVSGEGRALVQGINGGDHVPPGRRTHVSTAGVDGEPTLLSNAETYAQLAVAARLGAEAFAEVGVPEEPGTVLLTVTVPGRRPAVVETPTGTPLRQILARLGAEAGQAVLVGGYHGRWLSPAAAATAELSRNGMASVGGVLGAGIVLPMDDGTCPLGEVSRVAAYLAGQSTRQCGPCRRGLPDIARALDGLVAGQARDEEIDELTTAVVGRGACSHPDGTVEFVRSALTVFAGDVESHRLRGGCDRPVLGVLPLPGAKAVTAEARLEVDWTRCDGHGLCAEAAPGLLRLDANGYPVSGSVIVPQVARSAARRTVRACPAMALRFAAPRH